MLLFVHLPYFACVQSHGAEGKGQSLGVPDMYDKKVMVRLMCDAESADCGHY